jgi:hypothetical protein
MKMDKYKIRHSSIDGETYIHSDDGWQFPAVEDNRHYREYLAWLAEGNVAEGWDPIEEPS